MRQTTSHRILNRTLTAKRARKALSRSPSPGTNLSTVRRKIDATKPYHKQTIHHHPLCFGPNVHHARSRRSAPDRRTNCDRVFAPSHVRRLGRTVRRGRERERVFTERRSETLKRLPDWKGPEALDHYRSRSKCHDDLTSI